MSGNWTHEAIMQAREANELFLGQSRDLGLIAAILCFFSLGPIYWITKKQRVFDFMVLAFCWPLMISMPLGKFLTYYPLAPPTWLTLGYRIDIGGFMPTSCEVSLPIEGPRGLPCALPVFKTWLGKVLGGPHRWEPLIQPDTPIKPYLAVTAVWLAALVISGFTVRMIRRDRERCEEKKQREAALKERDYECDERRLEAGTRFSKLDDGLKQ